MHRAARREGSAQALEDMAGYVVRNSLSLKRLIYLDGQQAVIYRALKPNPTHMPDAGKHRTFIEVHLAKSRRISRVCGAVLPHIITTSYLTHAPVEAFLAQVDNYGYPGPLLLSPGRAPHLMAFAPPVASVVAR